jgi:hydroxyacylglutathione hydrolase
MTAAQFDVVPVRAFRDNYIWTIRDARTAVVVDPGDAAPVLDYLEREGLALHAILITHHHADHIGGVPDILERFRVPVYGPAGEPIPTLTRAVKGGDRVAIEPFGLSFEVLDIPGHTRAHIAYYGANMVFCGDTLFACGCGRVFEGTPAQMFASLSRLAALPDDTRVYCAHEYTLSNIGFARSVEPGNAALRRREADDRALRAADQPTVPTTIGREKATNPFLRCLEPEVAAAADKYRGVPADDPVDVFAALRDWKNKA